MVEIQEKQTGKTYSRHSKEAAILLGKLIRVARIERKITVDDLADRVSISRDMMRRIENGEPRCAIGAVFEAASIVGVPLFVDSQSQLKSNIDDVNGKLKLLPKAIHKPRKPIQDDF
jgi:transcriptional regulator with XRE-family HTH domain